jgi:hypothetical protein
MVEQPIIRRWRVLLTRPHDDLRAEDRVRLETYVVVHHGTKDRLVPWHRVLKATLEPGNQ